MIPHLYPMIEAVHRHHLSQAAQRYSIQTPRRHSRARPRRSWGFADLVGFTALTQQFTATDLDELLLVFEQHVLDAIPSEGPRLVKLIGDEAMFIAARRDLRQRPVRRTLVPHGARRTPVCPTCGSASARVRVLVRDGDVFGSHREPCGSAGERRRAVRPVLVDSEVASRLPDGAAVAAGTRVLPGFDAASGGVRPQTVRRSVAISHAPSRADRRTARPARRGGRRPHRVPAQTAVHRSTATEAAPGGRVEQGGP